MSLNKTDYLNNFKFNFFLNSDLKKYLFIFIFLPKILFSQAEQQPESSLIIPEQSSTISEEKENTSPYEMSKSPTGAVLRSLTLPGWGQIYVEDYWKAPLFLGAAGTLVYFIVRNNNKFLDSQEEMDNWTEDYPYTQDYLKRKREFYRDQRDMSAFYLLGVYVLAAVDAYVNAHLYDFNVDEPAGISLNETARMYLGLAPDKYGGLSLNLRINL